MGIHRCSICGSDPGVFYIWTTSRNFPRQKMIETLKIESKAEKHEIAVDGKVVCLGCLELLKK